jgi:hypothetical protein
MKTVHIVSSIKNLNHDYEHLQWLRLFFLSHGARLSEDWINHSLVIRNNKPYFKPAPNFDYMRVATDAINDSDLVVFLMSEPSTFTYTMLRYALHVGKPSVAIYGSRVKPKDIDATKAHLLTTLSTRNYRDKMEAYL